MRRHPLGKLLWQIILLKQKIVLQMHVIASLTDNIAVEQHTLPEPAHGRLLQELPCAERAISMST